MVKRPSAFPSLSSPWRIADFAEGKGEDCSGPLGEVLERGKSGVFVCFVWFVFFCFCLLLVLFFFSLGGSFLAGTLCDGGGCQWWLWRWLLVLLVDVVGVFVDSLFGSLVAWCLILLEGLFLLELFGEVASFRAVLLEKIGFFRKHSCVFFLVVVVGISLGIMSCLVACLDWWLFCGPGPALRSQAHMVARIMVKLPKS